jgi:hypothetical protein
MLHLMKKEILAQTHGRNRARSESAFRAQNTHGPFGMIIIRNIGLLKGI